MATSVIRILLVDDHAMVRSGIRLMLSNESDLQIAGEAANAEQALDLVQRESFHVALVDISLPDGSGLDLLKKILVLQPKLAVVMISMYAEDVYAVRALKIGAAGYLTKASSASELVAAIHTAAAGRKVISTETAQRLAEMITGAQAERHHQLSDREFDVMKKIAGGESLVAIALQLHLSPSTVTTYRARILEKMHMKTNADITRYMIGQNLL